MVALREPKRKHGSFFPPLFSLPACTRNVGKVNGHAWQLTPRSCCDMCAVTPAAWPLHWVIEEAHKVVLQRGRDRWRCWWEETEQRRRGRVGGLSSWVLSGSHHVPPRRPVSSCGPRAQGRKLDIGASTAGMLWEHCVCVCVCVWLCVSLSVSAFVENLCLTGGRLLSHAAALSLNTPPPTHLTTHYLTHCALWPGMSSPSNLHKRTRKTYARTGTSTHMDSIKHEMHGSL